MEQRRDLPRLGVDGSEIRALVLVAQDAREGQVRLFRQPAVLLGNDVVNPVRGQGQLLRYQPILTPLARTCARQAAERDRDVLLGHRRLSPA